MFILRFIDNVINAVDLTQGLVGKEVILPDGTRIGRVVDIELDLFRGNTWAVVADDKVRWVKLSTDQLTRVDQYKLACKSPFYSG